MTADAFSRHPRGSPSPAVGGGPDTTTAAAGCRHVSGAGGPNACQGRLHRPPQRRRRHDRRRTSEMALPWRAHGGRGERGGAHSHHSGNPGRSGGQHSVQVCGGGNGGALLRRHAACGELHDRRGNRVCVYGGRSGRAPVRGHCREHHHRLGDRRSRATQSSGRVGDTHRAVAELRCRFGRGRGAEGLPQAAGGEERVGHGGEHAAGRVEAGP